MNLLKIRQIFSSSQSFESKHHKENTVTPKYPVNLILRSKVKFDAGGSGTFPQHKTLFCGLGMYPDPNASSLTQS